MFEWDETKRLRILHERGLDFEDAIRLFDGRPMVHALSRRNDESRIVSTAEVNGKLLTIVWMWRAANQRIITFRRAHNAEERAYRQIHG
jgi:uncharacterized DUF497 family protein